MRGASAAFAFQGGAHAPFVSRAGSAPVAPPPPSTSRCALGGFDDANGGEGVRVFEGWIGRKAACRSFYSAYPGSAGYEPTNSNRDPDWRQRSIILTNAPYDANQSSDPTTRNRLRANGSMDAAMQQAADGLANVLANNSNYQTVILVENEYQCWWNPLDGGYDIEAWKEGVRRCYNICKPRLGSNLIYALCPTHNWPPNLLLNGSRSCALTWDAWYPGDAYCDAVGNTLYATTRPSAPGITTYGGTVEEQLCDDRNQWGPEYLFNFAVQRGKRFVVSEYGPMHEQHVWSFSTEYQNMIANFFQYSFDRWFNKSTSAACIFFHEYSGDGWHRIDDMPIAKQKFIQLWS